MHITYLFPVDPHGLLGIFEADFFFLRGTIILCENIVSVSEVFEIRVNYRCVRSRT